MTRTIERAIADDLIRAIYKAEGWQRGDKAGFQTVSARCNSLYEITADPRRNRYIAQRRPDILSEVARLQEPSHGLR